MKLKAKITISVGLFIALLAPGISASANPGPSKPVTVSDAEKNAPGVPEVVVPAKKETLAEVRARLRTEQKNSRDHSTTVTAFQCPDGEILLTVTHVWLVRPEAKVLPPPPGGYDKLPEVSREAACQTVKDAK